MQERAFVSTCVWPHPILKKSCSMQKLRERERYCTVYKAYAVQQRHNRSKVSGRSSERVRIRSPLPPYPAYLIPPTYLQSQAGEPNYLSPCRPAFERCSLFLFLLHAFVLPHRCGMHAFRYYVGSGKARKNFSVLPTLLMHPIATQTGS